MKYLQFASILFATLLLSSCAFHNGMMTGNASLGDTDFQVMTTASGSAKTTHIFLIGGLKKQALVNEARKNLYRGYSLGKNQVYANVSVDFKRFYFLMVSTTLATVTADIIQFGEISKADSLKYSLGSFDLNEHLPVGGSVPAGIFYPGQTVKLYQFQNAVSARIFERIAGKDKYRVEYLEPKSGETTKVRESKIYLSGKTDSIPGVNFRVGDPIAFNTGPNSTLETGVVYAIGTKNLLVKSGVLTLEVKLEECMQLDPKKE